MLSNGIRRICRNTYNMNLFICIFNIYVIISSASKSNQLNACCNKTVYNLAVNCIINEYTYNIVSISKINSILGKFGLIISNFELTICVCKVKGCLVILFSVKKCNLCFHLNTSPDIEKCNRIYILS